MAKLPMPFGNPATYAGHSGVDYGQPRGTAFRASGDGYVTWLGYNSRGGNFIWVYYEAIGRKVGYHHMDSHMGCPAVGTRISEGTILGYVGSTGNSTGPHLHSEVDGYATTDGYWRFFDSSRVVGRGGQWNLTSRPTADIQRAVGANPDGIYGPETDAKIRAFQTYWGLAVDGIWGELSDGVAFLTVDGIWGEATTRRVQAAFGVGIDGQMGPQTWSAIQRHLQITADGEPGPQTYKALQRALGVTADGDFGPASVAALQNWLLTGGYLQPVPEPGPGPSPQPDPGGIPPFPLPSNLYYFGPEGGNEYSISGHHGYGEDLRRWQAQVGISADGFYGYQGDTSTDTQTGTAAKAVQTANGLTVDGLIGPATWLAAWKGAEPVPSPAIDNRTSRPIAEIISNLEGRGFPGTTAGVVAFQATQGVDQDGIWGTTTDGLAFPPLGSIHGVDYSFARPDIATMVARGVKLAGRYLWRPKYDDGRNNKGISRDELLALNAAGIEVFFIYEEDGKELLGGFEAGVRVAKEAEKFLREVHGGVATTHPIYFNVDYDAPESDRPAIRDALLGIRAVIGAERTGLYAGYGPVSWAFDESLIEWGFQTYAWSGGKWDSRAQLQQWSNGQWGGSIDFTRAMSLEYGQHSVEPGPDPQPEPDPTMLPVSREWLEALHSDLEDILVVNE